MFEVDSKKYIFKMKEIWYAPKPYDVKGYDIVQFYFSQAEPDDTSFEKKKSYIAVIDLDKPMEEIYRNFNRNTQKEIRRARRENFSSEVNMDYAAFTKLWNSFMEHKKIKRYELKEEMLHMHKEHILVNIKDKAGRILAADYGCMVGQCMYLLYIVNAIGSIPDIENKVSMASRLAHYVIIEESIKAGMHKIDMGSLGDLDEEQSMRFKESFGSRREESVAYVKIYNPILKLFYK